MSPYSGEDAGSLGRRCSSSEFQCENGEEIFGPVFPIETPAGIPNAQNERYYASALALGFHTFCAVPCFMRPNAAAFQFKEFPDVDVFD